MSMGVAVVMLVVAVLIMVMMIVMVTTMMRMVMVMTVVIVMTVIVVMIMPMVMVVVCVVTIVRGMGGRIGAALGIERRLDLDNARAQPLHHFLDDVIAPDAQAPAHDLGRQMTVAEMPGDPHQMAWIQPSDFEQRLGRRHHLDQAAVFQHQRIAAAQRDGVFEVEQEFGATRTRHRHPPPVAVVEVEHHGIRRRFRPAILAANLRRLYHTLMVSTLSALMISIIV